MMEENYIAFMIIRGNINVLRASCLACKDETWTNLRSHGQLLVRDLLRSVEVQTL